MRCDKLTAAVAGLLIIPISLVTTMTFHTETTVHVWQ